MTGRGHYARAEDLMRLAEEGVPEFVKSVSDPPRKEPREHSWMPAQLIAAAQVHATLALAAALGSGGQELPDDTGGQELPDDTGGQELTDDMIFCRHAVEERDV